MVYSLISAPVLGFDLARLAGGADTAEILGTALTLRPPDLLVLAEHSQPDTAPRRAARARAMRRDAGRPTVRDLAALDPAVAIGLLERAPIGSLASLLRCLRADVLPPDSPDAAVTVIGDAVCTTYLRELLTDGERRELAAGWLSGRRKLPARPADLGPQADQVHALLSVVRTLDAQRVRGLAQSAERLRPDGDWSAAMHSVSWAVHLADRVRPAAAAQLLLVPALDLAGVPHNDRAKGVWNVLSGAMAAVMVRDLADGATVLELLVPCLSVLGSSWLAPN